MKPINIGWQSGQRGPGGGCGQPRDSASRSRLVKEARERGDAH